MKVFFPKNILVALSIVFFQILLLFLFGWNIFNYAPFYSDELHYYNAAKNFFDYGWESGYSILNESPSALNLQFGPHGPTFPVLIAISAEFFGWHTFTPILYNSLVLFLSSWALISTLESNTKKYKAAAIISSYSATVIFYSTTMQEITHICIALLFCTAFILKSKHKDNTSYNRKLLFFILFLSILAISLRSSWLPFIFLFFLFYLDKYNIINLILLLSLSILSIAWPHLTYSYYPSTTNFSMITKWVTLQSDFDTYFFTTQLRKNLEHIKDLKEFNISNSFRYFYYLVSGIVILKIITSKKRSTSQKNYLFLILLLALQFSLVFFLYHFFDYRDFRTLAPFLLFSCLIISIYSNRLFFIIFTFQLAMLAGSYEEIKTFRNFNFKPLSPTENKDLANLEKLALFSKNQNKYCNTISYINPSGEANLNRVVFLLGGGIGSSIIKADEYISSPIKSHYILLKASSTEELATNRKISTNSYKLVYLFTYSNDYTFGLYVANNSDC